MIQQKGFSGIETLLVLLAVAIIGFGGYYVWYSQQNKKTVTNTSSFSASTTPRTPTSSQNYLIIKEWDVKVLLDSNVSDLYYTQNKTDFKIFDFRTKRQDSLWPNCQTNSVLVERGLASDKYWGETGPSDSTFEEVYDALTQDDGHVKVKVGSYYFLSGPPGAYCSSVSNGDPQETQMFKGIRSVLNNLVAN